MTEFNFAQAVVERDPYEVERALVLQGVRATVQRLKRERETPTAQLRARPARQPASAITAGGPERPPVYVPDAALTIEERCRQEWNQIELRSEFSSLEQYPAYAKAIESGKARIFGQEDVRRPGSRRERTRPAGPSAEELIRQWRADAGVRAEFGHDFSRFAAYEAARARGETPARE